MNVDLPQRHIGGIGEAVRCAGGNDDDVARVYLTLFLADGAGGMAFLHQDQFIIVMPMKPHGKAVTKKMELPTPCSFPTNS